MMDFRYKKCWQIKIDLLIYLEGDKLKLSKTDKDLINKIRLRLPDMGDGERYEIFKRIMKDYCPHCGDRFTPCYCNDDV